MIELKRKETDYVFQEVVSKREGTLSNASPQNFHEEMNKLYITGKMTDGLTIFHFIQDIKKSIRRLKEERNENTSN